MKKIYAIIFTSAFCLLTSYIASAQYTKLYDFAIPPDGMSPTGALISDGTYLYGMTPHGGTSSSCVYNCGTIFKIKPDGTTYTKLYDFMGGLDGFYPFGSLVSDGSYLYGMTYYGGPNWFGTIFKIMPDGNNYSKLYDFAIPVSS